MLKYRCKTVLVSAAASNKSATRPPLLPPWCGGEWKENRQKPVGRDKGSLTEQQTKGTTTTTIQIRGIHRTDRTTKTDPLFRTGPVPHAAEPRVSPRRAAPPPPEPSVTARGMEYPALARWGQPPPPSCAPSWSPVKINPVLAKPRTKTYFVNS